jgi:hypothetical protein
LGVYVSFTLEQDSEDYMRSYIKSLGLVPPRHPLHVTTVHTQRGVDYTPLELDDPEITTGKLTFYSGTRHGLCLCLMVDGPILQASHRRGLELGADWSFQQYKPHITLSYYVESKLNCLTLHTEPAMLLVDREVIRQIDSFGQIIYEKD